jgi:N-acetylglutamate synthase-like GNAT family acetyltransferase
LPWLPVARLVDFSVRPALEADFPLILELIEQTRLNPSRLDWQHFVVAFSADGDFMGCAQVKPHRQGLRELASIAVRNRYRGLGVASALIETLLATHPRPIYLICRSKLGPFYEKFGFKPLQSEETPKYFRRVCQVMAGWEVLQQLQETILVMRIE